MPKDAQKRHIERLNSRLEGVSEELIRVLNGGAPETTLIRGQEFHHDEWLLCEAQELADRQSTLTELEISDSQL